MGKDFKNFNIVNEKKGELFNRQRVDEDLERKDKKAELVVEEGNVAFVLLDGTRQKTLAPGRYEIFGKKDGLAGIFDKKRISTLSIVFMANKTGKKDVNWGIPNREMELQDPLTEVDYKMGAFGMMAIQVANPEQFFTEWMTDKKDFGIDDFQAMMLPRLKSIVKTAIIKTIKEQRLMYHQLDENVEEISKGVHNSIRAEFERNLAINVVEFIINKITIDEQGKEEIKAVLRENKEEMKAKQKQLEEEQKAKELKAEQKADMQEIIAMLERQEDRDFDKQKYMMELEAKDRQMYLSVCRAIGWESSSIKDQEKRITQNKDKILNCPKCTTEYKEGAKFCPECAHKLIPGKCTCGQLLAVGQKFCPECARKVD